MLKEIRKEYAKMGRDVVDETKISKNALERF
jgi:hypothetical protein